MSQPYQPQVVEVNPQPQKVDPQAQQVENSPQNQQNIMKQLREQSNFLVQTYNTIKPSAKPGGVYVPPHKLKAIQEKLLLESAPGSLDHQKMMWELLRKSLNGIVNKVNIANIQNVVIELFNENILRGMGILAKAIIKAQMASPNFTHVYAALVAVINTKLPEIGKLIVTRVMIMFHRSFHRNNKLLCIAACKMLAHLINQRVLGEYAGLQLLMILLMNPSEDSVEIACDFMIQVGQVLTEVCPAGASAIFERFKSLLHEGEIGQKAQYSMEKLFAIRKTGFKSHPGVIPELDLVEQEDQIIHNMDFEEDLNGDDNLNIFRADPNFQENEAEWDTIKQEILGEENVIDLKRIREFQEEEEMEQEEQEEQGIRDLTEQDLINLRRTIYLAIQSTVNFEECAHKIFKMNIAKGYENELIDMIIECCMMERIYQAFFGLLSERFCTIDDMYKQLFIRAFVNHYNSIFKLEVNKIRNLAKLFAHLFYTQSIDWAIFQVVTIRQDTTTSAHRIFLKILFRDIAENMGVDKMAAEFKKQDMKSNYEGLFPLGHPNDVRFSINYFTSIGLGALTEEMREVLALQQEAIENRKIKEEQEKMMELLRQEKLLLTQQREYQQRIQKQQQLDEQQEKRRIEANKKQRRREEEMAAYEHHRQNRHRHQRHRSPSRSRHRKQRLSRREHSRSISRRRSSSRHKTSRIYQNRYRKVAKQNRKRYSLSSDSSPSSSSSSSPSPSPSSSSSSSSSNFSATPPIKRMPSNRKKVESDSESESSGISSSSVSDRPRLRSAKPNEKENKSVSRSRQKLANRGRSKRKSLQSSSSSDSSSSSASSSSPSKPSK